MLSVECDAVKHITGLPDSLLRSICSFLPPTSHLLLAVAVSDVGLSGRSLQSSWQHSPSGKAILSTTKLDTLDFGDNDVELVEKLTDDHIAEMLQCMDAANNLKQLRLTNCTNFIGHGLAPLRGSIVLEQIDLSIVRANDDGQLPHMQLSEDAVLPFLHDMINNEGSSVKQLQISEQWRQERREPLTYFLARYNHFLNARSICSSHQDHCKVAHNNAFVWVPTRESKYGQQSLICYECNNHICVAPEETNDYKNYCVKCEKTFCNECVPTLACQECKETTCHSCTHIGACHECHRVTCINCMPVLECPCCHRVRCDDCGPMAFCSLCDSSDGNCGSCPAEKLFVESCDFCEENFCTKCRTCTFCDDCGEMYCEACKDTLHHDECTAKRARTN